MPWFGQKGLGVQYKLPDSVQYYLDTLKLGGKMSWTDQELIDFLDRKNIPSESYSLHVEKNEAFCLEKVGDGWLIYYSERGAKK